MSTKSDDSRRKRNGVARRSLDYSSSSLGGDNQSLITLATTAKGGGTTSDTSFSSTTSSSSLSSSCSSSSRGTAVHLAKSGGSNTTKRSDGEATGTKKKKKKKKSSGKKGKRDTVAHNFVVTVHLPNKDVTRMRVSSNQTVDEICGVVESEFGYKTGSVGIKEGGESKRIAGSYLEREQTMGDLSSNKLVVNLFAEDTDEASLAGRLIERGSASFSASFVGDSADNQGVVIRFEDSGVTIREGADTVFESEPYTEQMKLLFPDRRVFTDRSLVKLQLSPDHSLAVVVESVSTGRVMARVFDAFKNDALHNGGGRWLSKKKKWKKK